MKILAFTAGAAQMYCGSCLRDNALAAELKRQGHDIVLYPLYTPTRVDEPNVSQRRVFMNGITVCLEQESAFFRKTRWLLDRLWDAPWLIRLATRTSIAVDARVLGEMTVSMLRGERGYQLKDIRKLTTWLASEAPPDVVSLPNALVSGLAKPIRDVTRRPVCCTLSGDELFLSQLQEPYRSQAWELVRANTRYIDGYAATSEFAAQYWRSALGVPANKVHVIPLGVNVEQGEPRRATRERFVLGFFGRIAPEKGLHVLAEAYIHLRRELALPPSELHAAGYLAPDQRAYLRAIEDRMKSAELAGEFRYRGEMDRPRKLEFFRGLDAMSVPFTYDETKGLSVLEAMEEGVPVVEPRRGTVAEVLERTGGGILVQPDDPRSLAEGILSLYRDRDFAAELGRRGARGIREHYSVPGMAAKAIEVYRSVMHAAVHA
jgi:glycosyltransferase involved in cell wall biosynthesis